MLSITIKNEISEMAALEPFLEQLGEAFELDMAFVFKLQLALDEAVANVVNYAYGSQTDMPITIEADVVKTESGRQLEMKLRDHGEAFDPLAEAPEVNLSENADERPIGGLGIFLIRQTMDEVKYARVNDENILTMIKQIL